MISEDLALFVCARCRAPLDADSKESLVCKGDGRHHFSLRDHTPLFLAASAERTATLEAVSAAYAAWISQEGPKWEAQRRRVWKAMVSYAAQAAPPPGAFADLGAGDGGLAALAARSNYQAVAIDAALPPEGPFIRASASFDALPFADGALRVVALCASLHYAEDVGAALREARRCLMKDGLLIIGLTPLNETPAGAFDGAASTREEMQDAGGDSPLSHSYHHLTRADTLAALHTAGFACELRPSGFSLGFRIVRALRERLSGGELARFPILFCRPRR